MAFIQDDDKLLGEEQQSGNGGGSDASVISGQGGSQVGSGAASNSGGVGAGGTGGWTNIQAYLGANKQDTGTADYVNKKVGDQFASEKSALDSSATSTLAQGQGASKKIQDASGTYKQTVADAAKDYDYGGGINDAYRNKTAGLRDALYSQYQGPNNFAYGFGDKTQSYAGALGNDEGFGSFLEDSYRERAGKPMTAGQLSLQRQLDTTNDPLAAARQNLLQQYSGLGNYRDTKVTETNSGLQKAAQDFGNYQNQLKNNMNNYTADLDTIRAQQEAEARTGYQNSFNNASGANIWDPNGVNYTNQNWNQLKQNRDSWANQAGSLPAGGYAIIGNNLVSAGDIMGFVNQADTAMNNHRQAQQAQYANTGDDPKRQWNTIMELLKNADRRQQGFNVTG